MATVPAGTKLGRYQVLKHLAKGGMADLLLARTSGLEGFERYVVIKRIREEQSKNAKFVEMFVTEARLAGALHHHNIVQVQDIGEENGRHFFAMEYVHGEDLRRILYRLHERREKMPLEHVVTIVATVAAALHHAHEQRGPDRKPLGIVHRDVTPGNILVGYDGNIKVVDFGIAKAATSAIQTERGVLKGKVPYMAPEQCTGQKVDRRSDVFALGIVAYELATIRRLFKGDTEYLTMSAIVSGNVPRPSRLRADLPPKLEQIILKALSRSPSDRFQTADEMRAALEDYASKVGMRMSATALAAYMKKLFGERPEPWLVKDDFPGNEVTVDWDGKITGLAEPPAEAVESFAIPKSIAATKSSPIAQAFTLSLNGTPTTTVKAAKEMAQLGTILPRNRVVAPNGSITKKPRTLPPPLPVVEEPTTVKRPLPGIPQQFEVTPPPAKFDGEVTEVDIRTQVASPPPLPKVIVADKDAERESTEIVPPLDMAGRRAKRGSQAPDPTRATSTLRTTIPRARWFAAGVISAVAATSVVVYILARSDDGKTEKLETPAVEAAPEPKPAPKPEPAPPLPSDDIPFEQRTANNSGAPAPAPEPAAAPSSDVAKAKPGATAAKTDAKAAASTDAKVDTKAAASTDTKVDATAKVDAKPAKVEPKHNAEVKAVAKPEPKHAVTVAKPAAKPAPKPAAKPASPQWDPDALFLKKK